MAKNITELTELTAVATNDLFIVEDVSASTTKKITWDNLVDDGSITAAKLADASVFPANLTSGLSGSSWAWSIWSPAYTNLTIGNGTVVLKYIQIGKTVHFRFKFTLGSTSAVGTNPTVSLPVTASTEYDNVRSSLGIGRYDDNNGSDYAGHLEAASTTTFGFNFADSNSALANIGASSPFAWAVSDGIFATGTYEAA